MKKQPATAVEPVRQKKATVEQSQLYLYFCCTCNPMCHSTQLDFIMVRAQTELKQYRLTYFHRSGTTVFIIYGTMNEPSLRLLA